MANDNNNTEIEYDDVEDFGRSHIVDRFNGCSQYQSGYAGDELSILVNIDEDKILLCVSYPDDDGVFYIHDKLMVMEA